MKNSTVRKVISIVLIVAFAALVLAACKKEEEHRPVKVETYKGEVTIKREGDKNLKISEELQLMSKDAIDVGEESNLELLIDTDKYVMVEENTYFELVTTGTSDNGNIEINLTKGSASVEVKKETSGESTSTFVIATPNAACHVKSAKFKVSYDKYNEMTLIEVAEGVVSAEYKNGSSEDIAAGENRIVTASEVTPVDSKTLSIINAYDEIVCDMDGYIASSPLLVNDYVNKEYMYYDYNFDGRKDLILQLAYFDYDGDMRCDVAFFKYYEDKGEVDILAVNNSDCNFYYGEYRGELVRYSWSADVTRSSIERVVADETGVNYLTSEAYNTLYTPDNIGLEPLTIYQENTRIVPGK